MSMGQRWIVAAKPASWPKLLTPFLLGQAIGVGASGSVSIAALLFGLLFTVFDLLFMVFLNDWGDREVDAIKRRMFPTGCGPKTIPDGILPAHHLLFAGLLAAVGAIATAFTAEVVLGRPGLGLAGVLALGIFVAYTLPPLKLNYRGGGELLEMGGVGLALPWLQAYLQGGSWLEPAGLRLLTGFALLSLASAIASGLADERSDRAGGKRTFVTRFGNLASRRIIEALTLAGACAWALTGLLGEALPWWLTAAPAMVVFWHAGAMITLSESAVTDAFSAHKRYKEELHRAIWRGALAAATLLSAWHLWPGWR
jgi:1,4-dihydroxy-2-naphthoate octaprenyltransferase